MKVYKSNQLTSKVLREIADVLDSLGGLYSEGYNESAIIAHFPNTVPIEGVWSGELGELAFSVEEEWVFHPAGSIFYTDEEDSLTKG